MGVVKPTLFAIHFFPFLELMFGNGREQELYTSLTGSEGQARCFWYCFCAARFQNLLQELNSLSFPHSQQLAPTPCRQEKTGVLLKTGDFPTLE